MVKPYYEENGIVIYHGDCREILPSLPKVDLVLTDPPYGIGRDRGMGGGGFDSTGKYRRNPKRYEDQWDVKPNAGTFQRVLMSADTLIIWGANYFSDLLPQANQWLVWNKEQVMPSYSDAELAWTNISADSVKMFSYGVNAHRADEVREHPTQKPLVLMKWTLGLVPHASTVLDPFMGSGTTLRAAKDLGRKAIGIEIEEKYCEIAARRLSQGVFDFNEQETRNNSGSVETLQSTSQTLYQAGLLDVSE